MIDIRNQNGGILTTTKPWSTHLLSHLLVIEKESFDKLGLADGRVTTKDEFEVTSLHLLRLSNSLVEDLLVVVRS